MTNRHDVTIDIAGLQDIAMKGVRRASAFIALGLRATASGPPESVALDGTFKIEWFPEPLPSGVGEEIAREYNAWVVSNGLKELDQFFGLFLDEVWEWTRLIQFHGGPMPSNFEVRDEKFRGDTNVARKLAQIEAALRVATPWAEYFQSYSRARNSLSHNAGIVRDRDANEPGCLRVRWRGPDVVVKDGAEEVLYNPRNEIAPRAFPGTSTVALRVSEREAVFPVGAPIVFTQVDLNEICFSYQTASGNLVEALARKVEEKTQGHPK